MLKYPSIENHFNIKSSRKITRNLDNLFYATEKIHGMNIQIEVDNKDNVSFYSRRDKLHENENHYNKFISASNTSKVIDAAKMYLKSNKNISVIHVFGELYGYKVQPMHYTENIDKIQQYRVFDAFVKENGTYRSLSQRELYDLFDVSLRVPDMNQTKTLREFISNEITQDSTLGGDIEGFVYKPVDSQVLDFEDSRIVHYVAVKHKTERFSEIKNKIKEPKILTDKESAFVEDIQRYFTMPRLEGVIGKLAIEASMQNLSKIIPAYLDDVKEDYIKTEEPSYFNEKLLSKQANQVVKLVKELLMNS